MTTQGQSNKVPIDPRSLSAIMTQTNIHKHEGLHIMMNGLRSDHIPRKSIKKKVSFADAAGLALVNVKTIPCHPFCKKDQVNFAVDLRAKRRTERKERKLSPAFVDPLRLDSFMERVLKENVCLANIYCNESSVTGVVWVTNIDFVKEVGVRVTVNDWNSYRDVWGDFLCSNQDKKTEQFGFRIAFPMHFQVGSKMKFAVRYSVAGSEFWDNNIGRNYELKCLKSI